MFETDSIVRDLGDLKIREILNEAGTRIFWKISIRIHVWI